jgi:hypothetical protein
MITQEVHRRNLETSTALSKYYVKMFIAPLDIIRLFNKAKISFVLVGFHGVGAWMDKPRATEDVDVIVASRHHKKAIQSLLKAFPRLEQEDHPVVTRFRDPETRKVAIDVMKPNQQLFREVFKHTKKVEIEKEGYRIPTVEMALTMKFAPMVSLHRQDEDKLLDAHDFIYIVKSNSQIDLEKLAELGDLVYPGGGKEIVEKVRQVRAGEKLSL